MVLDLSLPLVMSLVMGTIAMEDMAIVMARDMDIVMDMAMEAIGLMDMVDMEEVMDM